MLKKYKSKSLISFNVGSAHISFTPVTGGGSVFYTNNEMLQEGLEKHPMFNKLFKLETVMKESAPVQNVEPKPAPQEPKRVEFSNNEDAKDYFAEKFGASRTKLMTRKAIEEFGKQNGIEVTWV